MKGDSKGGGRIWRMWRRRRRRRREEMREGGVREKMYEEGIEGK